MTEVLFYHLHRRAVETILPQLLEKSLERGWRVIVQAGSAERIEALDAHLWTYRDDSFLPHGTASDTHAAAQPILLTTGAGNPNRASVRLLIDNVPFPEDWSEYGRIVVVFDGEDPDALAQARERWTAARAEGHDVAYWQHDEDGRWQRKG